MGNAYLYYYPERDGGIEKLDIGEGFEMADSFSVPQSTTTRGLGGQVFPTNLGRFDHVRITRNGIVNADTMAALRTFEAFADTRRPFAASADHAKSWAGYSSRILLRGTTTIDTAGNAFSALNSSGTIASGDYVVIETSYPEWNWEIAKVSSYSSNRVTLSAGLKRSYRETPVLIRWFRFWPLLALADGAGAILPQTGPVVWDLSIEAETISGATRGASFLSQLLESGTGSTKGGGKTTYHDLYSFQTGGSGRSNGNIGSLTMSWPR